MAQEKPQPRPGGMHGPMRFGGDKPKNFKKSFFKLLKHIARYRFSFALALICALGSVVFNVIGPKILGQATTELFNGYVAQVMGTGSIDFGKIAQILATVLGIYLSSMAAQAIQTTLMTSISQKVIYQLRQDIARKISVVPLSYFDASEGSKGDVLSRMTNDVDTLGQSLNQSIIQVITSVAQVIGVVYMMFSISVPLSFIAIILLPVSMIAVGIVVAFSQKFFRQQQSELGAVNGLIEEDISGQLLIQSYLRQDKSMAAFEEKNSSLYKSAWKAQFLSGLMQPIMVFVGDAAYVAVVIVGAIFAVQGSIQTGDIQSFIQYVRNLSQPIQQLATVSNIMQQMTAAAERVFEFLEAPEESAEKNLELLPEKEQRGKVDFSDVHFGYKKDEPIIKNFSAHVKPGQTIAIVGPTGAGKTTLMKLLLRFYDIDSGSITIDDQDISKLSLDDLRSHFAMVLQDSWMFKGSIRENIRFGRSDATDAEVDAAATYAHCKHFIDTLPGGMDFELNEGATNISQGQRQLLTIARAVLSERPILILDEATSNVDTMTEWRIQRSMDKLMYGRTSFVIAHRLSTIKDADLILVLDHGDIVESGNHQELLAQNGFYASLYNSQFESLAE